MKSVTVTTFIVDEFFCSNCDLPIYARLDREPAPLHVRLGNFSADLPAAITPQVCVAKKRNWLAICAALPRFGDSVQKELEQT